MLKIISVPNKDHLEIKIKGNINNNFELIGILDVIIKELKEQYDLSIKEILTMLINFKYDRCCIVEKKD